VKEEEKEKNEEKEKREKREKRGSTSCRACCSRRTTKRTKMWGHTKIKENMYKNSGKKMVEFPRILGDNPSSNRLCTLIK
jgi:hypothetical protein